MINGETGEPLIGATIQSSQQATTSGALGYFKLKVDPGEVDDIITISFLGFETQYLPLSFFSTTCQTIGLVPRVSQLKEVVITNYLATGINKRLNGSLDISPQSLQMLPGMTDPDILFMIQSFPGIISVDESVSNINIRSGTNDQNLILWEGIRMFQSGHFFGLISAFNPYFGDRVAITKNGTSAVYGNGVSGTISIASDREIARTVRGNAGLGLNMINGDINLEIPITKQSSLKVSSRRSITDAIRTPTFKKYFKRAFENTDVLDQAPSDTIVKTNDQFYFYDFNSRYNHRFKNEDHLGISFIAISNKLEFTESEISNLSTDSKTSGLKQQTYGLGTDYIRKWNSNLHTDVQVSLSTYSLEAINFDIPNDQRLIQQNEIIDFNAVTSTEIRTNSGNLVFGYAFNELGVESFEDINNPLFRRIRKEVLKTHALFQEANVDLNPLQLIVGIRANYYQEINKTTIEPRLALNYSVSNNLSFELLGELKSQATIQIIDRQTDFLGVEKRRWVLSNNVNVPLLQSRSISLGTNYQDGLVHFSLEGYVKKIEGLLSASQGFRDQLELSNESGSSLTTGVEALVNVRFQRVNSWLSLSYSESNYSFDNLQPTTFPSNFDIRTSISSGFSYKLGGFEFASGIAYRTGLPFTPVVDNSLVNGQFNYTLPNSSRIPGYFRVDLAADYQFLISERTSCEIGISFWNILDRKNVISRFYLQENEQPRVVDQRALLFTPNISARIFF